MSAMQQSAAGARCQGKSTGGEHARESSTLRGQRSARDARHVGNQAALADLRAAHAQAKLSVNTPGDRYEREADRVADAVMRAPSGAAAEVGDSISRFSPKPARSPLAQRRCAACDEEAQRKETSGGEVASSSVMPASAGQPLSPATRGFFEPRFGVDLGGVRVHTGGESHASARSLNALAYTVGSDIVFANGQFEPNSHSGRHLLAHELTHVIQQQGIGRRVQRNCGRAVIMPPTCTPNPSITPPSTRFLFDVNCDTFAIGEEALLGARIGALASGSTVRVVGLASSDQPASDPTLNDRLSCQRAAEGERVVRASLPAGVTVTSVEATGGVAGTNGNTTMRAVGIEITSPTPVPDLPNCGPDATKWFVTQVNTATTDPAVLAVQADMSAARALGARWGISLDDLAEGGAFQAVDNLESALAAGTAVGGPAPPPRAGAIVGQMAAGAAASSRAIGALPAALGSHSVFDAPAIIRDFGAMNIALANAALGWAALVTHRARYDFKMHTDSMHMPHAPGCPDETCPPGEHGTITMCPGTNPINCYESDMPGNMFFALIGRHVGMTELTLQLGSQLAELMDLPRPGRPVITFDTPDDTASISVGFSLPLPLSTTALCGAIGPVRATLQQRNDCDDCLADVSATAGGSAVIR